MGQPFLVGERIYLRGFEEFDITEEYVGWLKNQRATPISGTTKDQPTASDVRAWLKTHQDNTNNLAFAIVDKETDSHVGTIALQNIHWVHRRAHIDMLLGSKAFSVQDCGEEAMSLTIDYSFQRMGLHKILSTSIAGEVERMQLVEKLGFKSEVVFRQQVFIDGEYSDLVIHGLLSHEFKKFSR